MKKETTCQYPLSLFHKKVSISVHDLAVEPIFLSCCVLPHQVNSVCWASVNHLDSHILYLLAGEEVVGWLHPDVDLGVCRVHEMAC